MASKIEFVFFLTNFTTKAFCSGDTRPSNQRQAGPEKGSGTGDVQQMTALHNMANSKKTLDISFSRAKVKLLPSKRGYQHPAGTQVSHQQLTNNQSKILQFSGAPLALDRGQPPFEEVFRSKCSLFVHNNLSVG